MRCLLVLVLAVSPVARAEPHSFGAQFAQRSELEGIDWLPEGAQTRFSLTGRLELEVTSSAFRTDILERNDIWISSAQRRLFNVGAGLLVRVSEIAYVVGGGGVTHDGLFLRYDAFKIEGLDWVDADGKWRPQLFAGVGARWKLDPLVKGAKPPFLGVDVRGIALLGDGPKDMFTIPDVPALSVQGSVMLGLLL